MADSDSDNELQEDILMDRDDAKAERPKKKARSKQEKYIYEDADTIVDLADIKAMSSIASKKHFLSENIFIFLYQFNGILYFQLQNR